MPRKGENIRKRKDGRWEARYEKCRDQNGRIQYGYLYGRTYEAVKKKKLAILYQNNLQNSPGKCYVFRNLSEEWMLSMRYAVKLSTYACYETLTGTNRKCMEPRNIQRKFQKLLQQCEIPSINIHSLRHAFATRCTEMGFDSKTLSEILGHSSVKITMDIYVHSSIKQKQKCMEKLNY
nr:tyrosine-type recombinase/integrase [uncultured Blautia sp.]